MAASTQNHRATPLHTHTHTHTHTHAHTERQSHTLAHSTLAHGTLAAQHTHTHTHMIAIEVETPQEAEHGCLVHAQPHPCIYSQGDDAQVGLHLRLQFHAQCGRVVHPTTLSMKP